MGEQAVRDQNRVTSVLFKGSDGGTYNAQGDELTGRLFVDFAGGSGTVTSVSVVSANGLAGTVATATTTPAITLSTTITGILSGNGTAISAASTTGSGAVVLATSPTLVTPVLGTPASGTVTNLTGTASININGTVGATTPTTGVFTTLVAGSTTSLLLGTAGSAVGNIGFRNATSGTITLAPVTGALGTVTLTLPAVTDTVQAIAATQTVTNKRNQPRIVSAASYTTDTGTSLDIATTDIFVITAQAGALLFNAPGGTPVQGERLVIRIKDNGTARALTWNAVFRAMGVALPSTTVLSKTLYLGFFYNSTDTKWDLVASAQEA